MKEKLILSGTCNWCLEAIYLRAKGVTEVISGHYDILGLPFAFSKENKDKDKDKEIKEKIEVVLITYETDDISTKSILDILFTTYNPTLIKWDSKDCFYPFCRPLIVYENKEQKQLSELKLKELESIYDETIQTKIIQMDLKKFSKGFESQENFYAKNPKDAFCISVINPKIDKFKLELKHLFKEI